MNVRSTETSDLVEYNANLFGNQIKRFSPYLSIRMFVYSVAFVQNPNLEAIQTILSNSIFYFKNLLIEKNQYNVSILFLSLNYDNRIILSFLTDHRLYRKILRLQVLMSVFDDYRL